MEPEVIEEEISLFEDSEKPKVTKAAAVKPTQVDTPAVEIPDKFKGKSLEEVVTSYVHLEKEFGNKSNEVGQLRKLTDQILLNQTSQKTQEHPARREDINEDVGFDDFIDNPSLAVDRVLAKNPRLRKFEETLERNVTEASRKDLLSRHSDADAVVGSSEFQKWIMERSSRQRMLQEAHVSNDVDTASDLLDMYKTTRKAATDNAVDERDAIAKSDLKKATLEKGAGPANTKKGYYRREDLIQLKIRDPKRYDAMSKEIHAAYADGRVK